MKTSIKYIFYTLLLITLVGSGVYLGSQFSFFKTHSEINEEVLLERVRNVIKLGTVEATFSEIFNYSDYYSYDISPFRKKALIKIRANVLIGYDLDSIDIKLDYFSRTVVISDIPPAKIISIDHDLEYYDITEGSFNTFSKDDYNMLQKQSKGFIRKKVMDSKLFAQSDKQLQEHFFTLNWLLEESDWKLRIKESKKGFLRN